MTSTLNLDDIATLDRQIEQLNEYKPIPEHEVKQLCDKVGVCFILSQIILRASTSVLLIRYVKGRKLKKFSIADFRLDRVCSLSVELMFILSFL